MKLLTKAILKSLPPLGATATLGDEAIARVKFFTPDSNWTWWATEFDGEDRFDGLVQDFELEHGEFCLSELMAIRGRFGLPIERDMWFEPATLAKIKEKIHV